MTSEYESNNYPYKKIDVLPKVEGNKSVPRGPQFKKHILYQTTSQSYGKIPASKFELPLQRHPLKQTISAYQGSALGHRSGALNNTKTSVPLGEDGMYAAQLSQQKHALYTKT